MGGFVGWERQCGAQLRIGSSLTRLQKCVKRNYAASKAKTWDEAVIDMIIKQITEMKKSTLAEGLFVGKNMCDVFWYDWSKVNGIRRSFLLI